MPQFLTQAMYQHFAGTKNLIFANRQYDVEEIADALNKACRIDGRQEEFMVHHGSLSKESREFTEREMQGRSPRTTVCSSTLELGIDIGNVHAVGQIDSPSTVNALVQRLGRSGRGENEPQCMRLYVREHTIGAKSTLIDKLHLRLLHAIAIAELMLEKPTWVEPPIIDQFDLSTLCHQILSSLAETGGCPAGRMFENLCIKGAFRSIDSDKFARVLRCLGEKQLVEQMPQRELILAPKGEQMVRHYSFYSAFATTTEFSVLEGSTPIGMLPSQALPKLHDHFILGGRRWQVVGIETERREIIVKRSKGKKPPVFLGGNREVHQRVRSKMLEMLLSDKEVSYLDETATSVLRDARKTASVSRLDQSNFVALSNTRCIWFTWTGTRIQRTLLLLATSLGLRAKDHDVAIEFEDLSPPEVIKKFGVLDAKQLDSIALVNQLPSKQFRKLDELLSDTLLAESLAVDYIDVVGAVACLRQQLVG